MLALICAKDQTYHDLVAKNPPIRQLCCSESITMFTLFEHINMRDLRYKKYWLKSRKQSVVLMTVQPVNDYSDNSFNYSLEIHTKKINHNKLG